MKYFLATASSGIDVPGAPEPVRSHTVALPAVLNAAPYRGSDPQRYGVACRQVHEAPMMFDGTVAEQVPQQAEGVAQRFSPSRRLLQGAFVVGYKLLNTFRRELMPDIKALPRKC